MSRCIRAAQKAAVWLVSQAWLQLPPHHCHLHWLPHHQTHPSMFHQLWRPIGRSAPCHGDDSHLQTDPDIHNNKLIGWSEPLKGNSFSRETHLKVTEYAVRDHTCHPTQVNALHTPELNPSQTGSIYLPWRDERLSWPWCLVIYTEMVYLFTDSHPSKQ